MGLQKNVKLFVTICAVSWKSAVCHERNKDRLDKVSRGFQIETPSSSHVSEGAWNATPFWQLKIQPRNSVHSVDALVLYGNMIYSIRGILFNCINPDRTTACDTIRRADAYQRPHNPHCTTIYQIIHRHKHLFTNHRQIPRDQIPSHS